tara:strand:+ start:2831 stop:3205 length:375 start_codon:yes stop_codon:yes gene_type:complete
MKYALGYSATDPDSKRTLTRVEAVKHLQQKPNHVGCPFGRAETIVEACCVNQIRREGKRILQAGTNVNVQLKRMKGTRKDDGYVVECYSDNTVKVFLNKLGDAFIVPVDEFVVGRCGTSEVGGK